MAVPILVCPTVFRVTWTQRCGSEASAAPARSTTVPCVCPLPAHRLTLLLHSCPSYRDSSLSIAGKTHTDPIIEDLICVEEEVTNAPHSLLALLALLAQLALLAHPALDHEPVPLCKVIASVGVHSLTPLVLALSW
jgi:hypothetical protein